MSTEFGILIDPKGACQFSQERWLLALLVGGFVEEDTATFDVLNFDVRVLKNFIFFKLYF